MRAFRRAQGAGAAIAAIAGVLAAALIVGLAGRQARLLAGPAVLAPALQTGPSPGLIGVLAIEDARAPLPEDLERAARGSPDPAMSVFSGRPCARSVASSAATLSLTCCSTSTHATRVSARRPQARSSLRCAASLFLVCLRSSRPRLSSRRCRPPARRPRIGRSAGSRTRRQASFGRPNDTSRRRSRRVRRRESVLFGASSRSRG